MAGVHQWEGHMKEEVDNEVMYAPTKQRTLRTDSTHQTQKEAKKSYKIFMTLWFQISSPQIWGKCIYFVIEFVPCYQNNLRKLVQPGSRTPGVLVKCHSENPKLRSQPLWAWSHRIRFSKLSTHAFNEISNWESTGPGDSLKYLGKKNMKSTWKFQPYRRCPLWPAWGKCGTCPSM